MVFGNGVKNIQAAAYNNAQGTWKYTQQYINGLWKLGKKYIQAAAYNGARLVV